MCIMHFKIVNNENLMTPTLINIYFNSLSDKNISSEHQSDHRVILFKMNLKPATILDNKESYNYNKTDFSAMIIFMRSVNWKDGLCGENMERSWHIIRNIVDQHRKFCSKDEKNKEKETFMDG